jgi:hypothetical protein
MRDSMLHPGAAAVLPRSAAPSGSFVPRTCLETRALMRGGLAPFSVSTFSPFCADASE